MACFTVPAAEAVIAAVAKKTAEKKEKKTGEASGKIPFSRKLGWLTKLLCGGAVLLAFEHVWHGEVVPWFPFLTAASDPADAAEMLHEMATVGVTMAVLVTLVWVGMLIASAVIEKRSEDAKSAETESRA